MTSFQDYLKLHFLVFLWGFTAIIGKLITLPAMEMVFYRTILAALGIAFLLLVTRRPFVIAPIDVMKLLATGSIVAVHWLTFFLSGRVSNASTSLVGFATCSLWTALLEPMLKGKRIQRLEVVLALVVLIGLNIIFVTNAQFHFGLLLGVASGITIAFFAIINSELVKRLDSYTITLYEMIGAAITLALFFPVYINSNLSDHQELQLTPTSLDWLWLSILAFVCTVYAYAAAINLMKRMSVFTIQLTLNLEPVYGILLALLVFRDQEVMDGGFYLGSIIILGTVLLYPWLRSRENKKATALKS